MSIEIRGEYTYRVADACQVLSPDCEKLYRDTAIVYVGGIWPSYDRTDEEWIEI